MSALQTLITLFPIALASGINLYATVLIVGLCARLGWVDQLPGDMEVLGSLPVLVIAGLLYALEFVADKIPTLDNIWDLIHTPIRPLGAAAVALIAVTGADTPFAVVIVLLAGGVALLSHGGKAGTRVASNVSNPASAVTNPIVSVVEDASVAGLTFFALKYPIPAAIVSLVILILIIIFVPLVLRWTFFALRALLVRLQGFVRKITKSESLPADHRVLLDREDPRLSARCKAQGIRGANGRSGFLSLAGSTLYFTYDRWFRSRRWALNLNCTLSTNWKRRFLVDILEIVYLDEKSKKRVARFAFTKDREPLMKRFQTSLEGTASAATT